jgi:predicted outer membrane repeat protein
MFQTKIVEKFKIYILCSKTFFFSENSSVHMEKYGGAGQATNDNIIRRLCFS